MLQSSCSSVNDIFPSNLTPSVSNTMCSGGLMLVQTLAEWRLSLCVHLLTPPTTGSPERGGSPASCRTQTPPGPTASLGQASPNCRKGVLWIRSVVSSIFPHWEYQRQVFLEVLRRKPGDSGRTLPEAEERKSQTLSWAPAGGSEMLAQKLRSPGENNFRTRTSQRAVLAFPVCQWGLTSVCLSWPRGLQGTGFVLQDLHHEKGGHPNYSYLFPAGWERSWICNNQIPVT